MKGILGIAVILAIVLICLNSFNKLDNSYFVFLVPVFVVIGIIVLIILLDNIIEVFADRKISKDIEKFNNSPFVRNAETRYEEFMELSRKIQRLSSTDEEDEELFKKYKEMCERTKLKKK